MADEWAKTAGPFTNYMVSCGKSVNTCRTYASGVIQFWRWCARYEMTPFEAAKKDLRDWIAVRLETVSPSRAHNDLAGIRTFYAWLRETGYRDDDPTTGVTVKRGKRLPTKPLSESELSGLLKACSTERDRLLVAVLAYTGLRITEMATLKCEDIDWRQGTFKIRGKGDKERVVAPSPDVLNRLHAFCGMFPTGPVWMSQWGKPLASHQIRKIIYNIAAAAGIKSVHPHRFRAFFATQYIEQFADIQALQGVMGHESIETTAAYSQWTRERRGLDQMRRLKLVAG